MLFDMKNIEIIIERNEFKDFLVEEKNALEENSLTIAQSKHYDSDGLKMVVDYDGDHYSIRLEDFETSDIEFVHLFDNDINKYAESLYDLFLLILNGFIITTNSQNL